MRRDQSNSVLTGALDAIIAASPRIDLAFSRDDPGEGRIWLRPDALGGRWARLGNLDRAGVQALAAEAWARNLGAERWGVHWRPCAPAALVLLDDLSDADADAISGRYRALIVSTSTNSNQVWLLCDKPLTRLEQHAVQSELVHRLNAGQRRADPGACAGGQFGRLPGFRHPGHAGRAVDVAGRPWSGAGTLDAAALISARATRLVDAPSPAAAVCGRASPCSPRGPRLARSDRRGKGAIPARPALASASEVDFRFACNAIRSGDNADLIISALAESALSRGKRVTDAAAREYATRTYTAACRAVRGQPEHTP